MKIRNVFALPLAALPLCFAIAQQGHGTARDAFWSASDLISVTPNPAAHPHSAATHKPHVAAASGTSASTPSGAPAEEMASTSEPPRPRRGILLASANGYGAAPHLLRASESRLGLRYSVLLRGPDGQYAEVRPGTTFHSGDHIRLSLMSNEPGYLYVIQQGSSGNWSPIFPPPGMDTSRIDQGKLQEVPDGTRAFSFDQTAGEEKLFVILSQSPIADLDRVIQGLKGGAKGASSEQQAPSEPAPVLEAENHIPDLFVQQMATRDLTLVDEQKVDAAATAEHGAEKAVYVVSKTSDPGQSSQVVAKIELHHE